jgi:hypothetical protein
MTDLLTPAQYGALHGISGRRVLALLAQGRIPGACRVGIAWAIPADAPLVTGPPGRPPNRDGSA